MSNIKYLKMKSLFLKFKILTAFLGLMVFANAQKIGVVDTDYILDKMPQYKDAEGRLNAQVATWQSDIQNLQSEFERKRTAFENEKVLLVGEQLRQREKEVMDLDKNIKTTISLRFGTNGEIETLRKNLTQPFQDQIWTAIKTISEKNGLGIVIDKSNNTSVIFLNSRYDYTEKVLNLLLKGTDDDSKKSGSKK